MMSFDQIAVDLLREHGYEPVLCTSDEEAIDRAEELKKGSRNYPVHFSVSNTSGEKTYEEFYTDTEHVDMERMQTLGVVTEKEIPGKESIRVLFEQLSSIFEKAETTKEEVVEILQNYLPNFAHIETGKSLDSKM